MSAQHNLEHMPRLFPPDPTSALATVFAYSQARRSRAQLLAARDTAENGSLHAPRQQNLLDRLTEAGHLALSSLSDVARRIRRAGSRPSPA